MQGKNIPGIIMNNCVRELMFLIGKHFVKSAGSVCQRIHDVKSKIFYVAEEDSSIMRSL